jgi:hypothetical protein
MIYFIINNNYQYFDFKLHLKSLNLENISIIEIPHTLENYSHSDLSKAYRYELVFNKGRISRLISYIRAKERIKNELHPSKEDICFVYTEYEILNQVVVNKFKKAGCRIYLIEDGGMGTYALFRRTNSEKLSFREIINRYLMRVISGVTNLRFQKINNQIFPWMPDQIFEGVCVYQPISINRQIPVLHIKRPEEELIVSDTGTVIFLNEDITAEHLDLD